jgi:hypothetical protein
MAIATKAYSHLQAALTSLPESSVKWLPENFNFPEDLFEDLSSEDGEKLRLKLDKIDTSDFPELVVTQAAGNEKVNFLSKSLMSKSDVDLGGK